MRIPRAHANCPRGCWYCRSRTVIRESCQVFSECVEVGPANVRTAKPLAETFEAGFIFPAQEPLNGFFWQAARGDGLGNLNGMFDGFNIRIDATVGIPDQYRNSGGGLDGAQGVAALSGCCQHIRNITQRYLIIDTRAGGGQKNVAEFSGKLVQTTEDLVE